MVNEVDAIVTCDACGDSICVSLDVKNGRVDWTGLQQGITETSWYHHGDIHYCPECEELYGEWASTVDYTANCLPVDSNPLRDAARSLALNLPDAELDIAGEVWGWTNVAVVKSARDKVLGLIEKG